MFPKTVWMFTCDPTALCLPAKPTLKGWQIWSPPEAAAAEMVTMEASGGYEEVVAAPLTEADLPVAIVNPRQIRQFAGAQAGS